jgi:hypothetical protein
MADTFDIDRSSDWLHAVTQWKRGDARAVADFVLRWGVQSDDERRQVADMLTTKPDARRGLKAHTTELLDELARMLERRHRSERELAEYVDRLRRRLAGRDWTDAQIAQALQRRRRCSAAT